jgi:hypothetical protein
MHFVLPIIEVLGAFAMFFLLPCKERWARICIKLAGCAILAHVVLSHYYAQITIHRIYFAYYAGLTAGLVIGIFFVLLIARQLGRRPTLASADPMLN